MRPACHPAGRPSIAREAANQDEGRGGLAKTSDWPNPAGTTLDFLTDEVAFEVSGTINVGPFPPKKLRNSCRRPVDHNAERGYYTDTLSGSCPTRVVCVAPEAAEGAEYEGFLADRLPRLITELRAYADRVGFDWQRAEVMSTRVDAAHGPGRDLTPAPEAWLLPVYV